ncbi:MAG: helix-turn-helix domain-containing protein [Pyrinomonadaceae bacterium]
MQIDFYNPRSIILFFCILQGLIFAALLALRGFRKKKRADFWLAVLLVLLCLSLVTPFIGFANVYDLNQWLTYFPFTFSYTYGVCIYFYVLSLTDSRRKFKPKDLLLFVPAILYLIFRFTLFAQNSEFKDWFNEKYYIPVVNPFVFVTELVWNVVFLWLAIKHYRKYRAWLDENFSDTEKIKFDWLRNFLYVFTFVLVAGAIFDFTDSFVFHLSYIQYFYFELILALVTYYLAIAGYLRSETIELEFNEVKSVEIEDARKTLLSEEDLENFKIKLQKLMENEKPFLNPQITLNDLAKNLGVNSAVLSYAINRGFGRNFNDFINEFRISEVKAKLRKGEAASLTLLGIALDSGFNSKATFNRAFKKITGTSPKEFQEKKI